MTRRSFVSVCSASLALGESMVRYPAVVAPMLPSSVVLPSSIRFQSRLFEWRKYRDGEKIRSLLTAEGHRFEEWNTALLIPFDSLGQRESFWRNLPPAGDYDFAIYRAG